MKDIAAFLLIAAANLATFILTIAFIRCVWDAL